MSHNRKIFMRGGYTAPRPTPEGGSRPVDVTIDDAPQHKSMAMRNYAYSLMGIA